MTTARTPPVSAFAYQPALDGVRALAVVAVLLFHGGVAWLPGGFLGVDAFFVLSGFLITSLLLAERRAPGGSGSARSGCAGPGGCCRRCWWCWSSWWPCSATLLPPAEVGLLRGDALAALGYVANWRMIYRGDDYFAADRRPRRRCSTPGRSASRSSSTSLWPLIVAALLACAAAAGPARWSCLRRRRGRLGGRGRGCCSGPLDVNRAYFGTDTRAQALLIGCALAAVLPGCARSARRPAVAGVLACSARWRRRRSVIGWLWTHARRRPTAGCTAAACTVGALAVAAVLGRWSCCGPRPPLARVLGAARRWSGSAASRTASTCGTGRCSRCQRRAHRADRARRCWRSGWPSRSRSRSCRTARRAADPDRAAGRLRCRRPCGAPGGPLRRRPVAALTAVGCLAAVVVFAVVRHRTATGAARSSPVSALPSAAPPSTAAALDARCTGPGRRAGRGAADHVLRRLGVVDARHLPAAAPGLDVTAGHPGLRHRPPARHRPARRAAHQLPGLHRPGTPGGRPASTSTTRTWRSSCSTAGS